jgi:hypothetical protein
MKKSTKKAGLSVKTNVKVGGFCFNHNRIVLAR